MKSDKDQLESYDVNYLSIPQVYSQPHLIKTKHLLYDKDLITLNK